MIERDAVEIDQPILLGIGFHPRRIIGFDQRRRDRSPVDRLPRLAHVAGFQVVEVGPLSGWPFGWRLKAVMIRWPRWNEVWYCPSMPASFWSSPREPSGCADVPIEFPHAGVLGEQFEDPSRRAHRWLGIADLVGRDQLEPVDIVGLTLR